jgi:hypothetical protein
MRENERISVYEVVGTEAKGAMAVFREANQSGFLDLTLKEYNGSDNSRNSCKIDNVSEGLFYVDGERKVKLSLTDMYRISAFTAHLMKVGKINIMESLV